MTKKFSNIIFLVSVLFLFLCCDQKPKLEKGGEEPFGPGSEKVSIAYLKALYLGVPVTIERQLRIEGWVVSNDGPHNHYHTLYLEDNSGAIALRLEMDSICMYFPYGSRMSVSCNSLSLGTYGGLLQLGERSTGTGGDIAPIPFEKIPSVTWSFPNSAKLPIPLSIKISGLSPRYLSCYVRIKDVQFLWNENGLNWTDEDMDTNRHLIDKNGDQLIVRTSRYANFANYPLPVGSGDIDGILGWFNGEYQLIVSDHREVEMKNPRF